MTIRWAVQYQDGSTFYQFCEGGTERSYDSIPDREKIVAFALLNHEEKRPILVIHLEPWQKLVFRRRVEKSTGKEDVVVYLAGWRACVDGKIIESIAFVFEKNGNVELSKFREKTPWFYAPIFRDCERLENDVDLARKKL